MDLPAASGLEKEIIVVDDCSSDGTAETVARFPDVILCRHEQNGGKGRAVRTGIERATGDYVMIQDADLEYDPQDYVPMVQALLSGRARRRVRQPLYEGLLGSKHAQQSWPAYLGGRSLSIAALICTGTVSHRYGDRAEAVSAGAAQRTQPADDGLRAGSRNHLEGARARTPHRRSSDSLFSAEPRGREEDRREGLGHRPSDVLAISSGMNAIHTPSSRGIAAPFYFGRHEPVGR